MMTTPPPRKNERLAVVSILLFTCAFACAPQTRVIRISTPQQERKFSQTIDQPVNQVWDVVVGSLKEWPIATIERASYLVNTDWMEVGFSNYYNIIMIYDPGKNLVLDIFPSAKKKVKLIVSLTAISSTKTEINIVSYERIIPYSGPAPYGYNLKNPNSREQYKRIVLNPAGSEGTQVMTDGIVPEQVMNKILGNFSIPPVKYTVPQNLPTIGQTLDLTKDNGYIFYTVEEMIKIMNLPPNTSIQDGP